MPLTNSYNITATANEQPEYQCLWEPMSIVASSTVGPTAPAIAGGVGWVPGALLMYTNAGIGATPGPGGDGAYTVQTVDLAAINSTTYLAGILLGVGTLGGSIPAAPNTVSGAISPFVAMVAKRGICQVYTDVTSVVGHTILASSTTGDTGVCKDSGGTTNTYGTHFGVFLQAVTVTAALPILAWAKINFP